MLGVFGFIDVSVSTSVGVFPDSLAYSMRKMMADKALVCIFLHPFLLQLKL